MTDPVGGSGRPPSPASIIEGLGSPPERGSPHTATLGAPEHSRGAPRQRDALAETDLTALIALLQFSDGLFPSGGFAHSFGLETYAQERTVRDAAGLRELIRTHLEGSAGPADAVAAALAARAGHASDLDACIELDRALDAMKTVPESRAASRQMGRQTSRAAAATLGPVRATRERARATPGRAGTTVDLHETTFAGEPFVESLAAAIDDELMPGHHAMIFGAVTGRWGASPEIAAAAFLQSTAALLVGAGLRLLPIGQLDGQRVLASVREPIARLARRAAVAGVDDMWSFTPGLEIAGVRHAGLEGRLFRS